MKTKPIFDTTTGEHIMSKLPNAPLLEVVFELKWNVTNNSDMAKSQFLFGDLFSQLKTSYPAREVLISPEVPLDLVKFSPVYRFRKEEHGYPIVQVGPGLLTLNTTDESYFWDEYYNWLKDLLNVFFNVFKVENEKFVPFLSYYDFFATDGYEDPLDFINENLGIKIENNSGLKNITNTNLSVSSTTEHGIVRMTYGNGIQKEKKGILMETQMSGIDFVAKEDIIKWADVAYQTCSNLFKEITKGSLYESFKG